MIEVIIQFSVKEGKLEEAKSAIKEFIAGIKLHEEGTLSYRSLQDSKDPLQFYHTMAFRDAAAHQYHRESAHCLAFVDKLYPLCEVAPKASFVEFFDGTEKK